MASQDNMNKKSATAGKKKQELWAHKYQAGFSPASTSMIILLSVFRVCPSFSLYFPACFGYELI